MKLRPESSILLAAALALGAAVACEPASPDNDGPINPTGGTGGAAAAGGTASAGGAAAAGGTASAGGVAAAGGAASAGGVAAAGGTASAGGVAAAGGTASAGGVAAAGGTASAGGGDAGVDGGSPGGTTGGGMWVMPNPSKVKGTAGMCLSVQTPMNGKCGSYYCNVDKATLSPEINPAAPCGKDADGMTGQAVWDYVCEASLPATVTTCAGMHTDKAVIDLLTGGKTFETATLDCVKADAVVKAKKVPNACLDCFAKVAFCCAADAAGCAATCAGGASKECDDAQKAKGCVSPLFACGGLPNPFM